MRCEGRKAPRLKDLFGGTGEEGDRTVNSEMRPLVVALTVGVLLGYVGTFGAFLWGFASDPHPLLAANRSLDPESAGAIDYIWTSASVLVGSVVAVALGQPTRDQPKASPSVDDLILVYGWTWLAVGAAAIVFWIWGTFKEYNTPLMIRNAATTFVGLALPVVAAFLKDRDSTTGKFMTSTSSDDLDDARALATVCPFATAKTINGAIGNYNGDPYKIVHHTTEGPTAQSAFNTYATDKSDPHYTVDDSTIYEHIDPGKAARALANDPNAGVETNRDSAIQIEIVGYAGKAKSRATLLNVARLCRWLEKEYGVPQDWPNGRPKPPKNGKDPGGHNRDPKTWDTKGGHYGHSNVPENIHWDPAYTQAEGDLIMAAKFDERGTLLNPDDPAVRGFVEIRSEESFEPIVDHGVVKDY